MSFIKHLQHIFQQLYQDQEPIRRITYANRGSDAVDERYSVLRASCYNNAGSYADEYGSTSRQSPQPSTANPIQGNKEPPGSPNVREVWDHESRTTQSVSSSKIYINPDQFDTYVQQPKNDSARGFVIAKIKQCEPGRCDTCGAWKRKDLGIKNILGLVLLFFIFASLGAVIFHSFESAPEHQRREELLNFINIFLAAHPCINRSEVFELMEQTIQDNQIAWYVLTDAKHLDRWEFINSFGFVIALVTTIGYGTLAPFTVGGKIMCVVVAVVGIPLTLIVLSSIGQKLVSCYAQLMQARCVLISSPMWNRRLNAFFILMLGNTVVFVVPSFLYAYIENWNFGEALYFCFTSLSTIGFGDYVIGMHEDRLVNNHSLHQAYIMLAYVWILVGLSYLSLLYSVIMESVIAIFRQITKTQDRTAVQQPKTKADVKNGQTVQTRSNLQ